MDKFMLVAWASWLFACAFHVRRLPRQALADLLPRRRLRERRKHPGVSNAGRGGQVLGGAVSLVRLRLGSLVL